MERIVVKIGTSVIVKNGNGLDRPFMDDIARQVADIRKNYGIQTLIVSSGAVASGRMIEPSLSKNIIDKQVAAMFGQPELMTAWIEAFRKQEMLVGEALLKDDDLDNFKNPLKKALGFGVVVANGNDAIYDPTTEEEIISIDNDRLARVVGSKNGADLLIMLTEKEGILDKRRRVIRGIIVNKDLDRIDFFGKTSDGTGGPSSKLMEARSFLTDFSKIAYIAGARIENVIVRIVKGERVGTRITLPLQGYFNI